MRGAVAMLVMLAAVGCQPQPSDACLDALRAADVVMQYRDRYAEMVGEALDPKAPAGAPVEEEVQSVRNTIEIYLHEYARESRACRSGA